MDGDLLVAFDRRRSDEGHVNGTVLYSIDQAGRVALHGRQDHARISSPIGLNESRHARLEIGCTSESDADVSGFATCPISNICFCPFYLRQNLSRLVQQQCPGLGKLAAARQTTE